VPFQVQNRLLARLAPMHDEIVEGRRTALGRGAP